MIKASVWTLEMPFCLGAEVSNFARSYSWSFQDCFSQKTRHRPISTFPVRCAAEDLWLSQSRGCHTAPALNKTMSLYACYCAGTYFSPPSSPPCSSSSSFANIDRVLLGKMHVQYDYMPSDTIKPSIVESHNSVLCVPPSNVRRPREILLHDHALVYPEFIITYKRSLRNAKDIVCKAHIFCLTI